jgi:SAM-dependent methyltransferase
MQEGGTGVHRVAAQGFAAAGQVYERGRPDYPPEAVACLVTQLGIGAGSIVVDVGAGTGKLTRLLIDAGAQVTAVEPVADMRRSLARALPGVPVLDGTAEALPLDTATADAVVAGAAFHWFDGPAALREIHRVLRPGGGLGLVWNPRDETVAWVAQLVQLVDGYKQGDPPRYTDGRWRRAFNAAETAALFTPLEEAQFPFGHEVERDVALTRVASTSFVGALPPAAREEVLARARALLDTHPDTRHRPMLRLPYRADVYWCRKRAAGAP